MNVIRIRMVHMDNSQSKYRSLCVFVAVMIIIYHYLIGEDMCFYSYSIWNTFTKQKILFEIHLRAYKWCSLIRWFQSELQYRVKKKNTHFLFALKFFSINLCSFSSQCFVQLIRTLFFSSKIYMNLIKHTL